MVKNDFNKAEHIACIYKFTNTINNKSYIGQSVDLHNRLRLHYFRYVHNVNTPLYNAMRKYGIEPFTFQILEIVNIENLTNIEIKKTLGLLETSYIEKYNSNKFGYNQTIGGDNSILGYKFTDKQKETQMLNSKKVAMDGRFKVYCYNINTNEIFSSANLTELSNKLQITINPSDFRSLMVKSKYVIAKTLDELENKKQKVLVINNKKKKIENELYDFYQNHTVKQTAEYFGISLKTVFNTINKYKSKH